ncbi:MAG: hypothetical protein MZU95_16985 [Desulfomicrobium escambiense]|nr:hypothetical protein [Desulfomicrobium escambiense]
MIGTLVDAPATMINAVGDTVSSMMVARVLGGKELAGFVGVTEKGEGNDENSGKIHLHTRGAVFLPGVGPLGSDGRFGRGWRWFEASLNTLAGDSSQVLLIVGRKHPASRRCSMPWRRGTVAGVLLFRRGRR